MYRRHQSKPKSKAKASTKPRSIRHPKPFMVASQLSVLHFVTLPIVGGCVVAYLVNPGLETAYVLVGSVAVCILTRILAYFKRKAVSCPMCKGSPLLNSGALPHAAAERIRPFNYGISAILSILFTHHFRCMYCGIRYDLTRQPRDYRQAKDEFGMLEEDPED